MTFTIGHQINQKYHGCRCSNPYCAERAITRGMCQSHYDRWKREQKPALRKYVPKRTTAQPWPDRFVVHVRG